MARYIGPKTKISRKFGELIYGKTNKSFEKKKYPPGNSSSRNIKKTFYSTQLLEKQKIKYTYGILERQFLKMFYKASKKKGIKGEILLQLCESRLDNIVYRLNLSHSRPEARQLVSHRHITVNGKIVNIPSFNLKPGDKISLKEKHKHKANKNKLLGSDWLSWDNEKMIGIFKYIPNRNQITENINEKLIVELYSK
ncbi:MAG: 30S ribosomal protein S4 [Candidatus Sulcia muelleri]|uniref:Small ribosomal subunit protein uS4 n=1 Tax=Karelsulcia muelleri (strain GWSS) TaxID=444179 RepID=RS4_KARMG|nr:RecName: Full=Small ribosomal subunit protein uS4; AltName: Full=30S ribosomal protein S4 [Candidatus Karelsulcia muelleri GWSS]ABS30641.1 30S ribosomal subunit protein S4 [Candidatus Karelsulcia muelleri GWSS]EAT14135.1 30S ribosomal protein S4 [Candidatus Karelsulcia muelleri str. Hc (Homalodisca coagulata)]MCJ7422518.1 30S ribosomal protein S4 [Candidatus Karelsulcia muelleri]MCJ7468718.1 30S ribosomal protein S4 [Candidatus Karelsulcia muelleri]